MGRPKGFDRDEVLDRAIEVFSRKGFEAASIQELLESMGINRFSLYDTFGDKHGLFLAALDRYSSKRRAQATAILCGASSKKEGFRLYFETIMNEHLADRYAGCMLVNSAIEMAAGDRMTGEKTYETFTKIERVFVEAIEEGKRTGELSSNKDSRAIARFLISTSRGMRVLAKTTHDRSILEDVSDVALSILD